MTNAKTSSDVIIIGGGVIGLMSAWQLAKAGLAVTLYERGKPGAEASSAALGLLLPGVTTGSRPEDDYAILGQASLALYSDVANSLLVETGLDIELRDEGTLEVAYDASDLAILQQMHRLYTADGIETALLSVEQTQTLEPGISNDIVGALYLTTAKLVDNARLGKVLTLAATQAGVTVNNGHPVTGLHIVGDRVDGVIVGGQTITAGHVVLAAGSWSGLIEGVSVPVRPAKGQALSVEAPILVQRSVTAGHTFVVPRRDGRIIIGSTIEDVGFDKRSTVDGIQELLTHATRLMPKLGQATILQTWAGLRPRAIDDMPIIGPYSALKNLFVATGHFRNGILLAPITAQCVTHWVTEKSSMTDISAFSPNRFE